MSNLPIPTHPRGLNNNFLIERKKIISWIGLFFWSDWSELLKNSEQRIVSARPKPLNSYIGLDSIPKPKTKLADTFGRYCNWYRNRILKGESKGQLISKHFFEAIVFPKKRTKYCKDFCPSIQGRNPCNISFVFWEKRWFQKSVLRLTDL